MAAKLDQSCDAAGSTRGSSSSQAGGGRVAGTRDWAHEASLSAFLRIVMTASERGTTKTSRSTMVMTMTASARLFQSRAWILSISGQVATTIMVAQTAAGRNGCRIQNEAAASPTI